ncbi:MAG: hydroxysqualene dehydroxylase HpnE [Sterolibacterium sp.]
MAQKLTQVAVIGAGYAGVAAAVELTARGIPVALFESSRQLGGRARAVEVHGTRLDNGLHILLGAYRETLRLMQLVGADAERNLLRRPLTLAYPGELHLAAPRLPAPLHMLAALLTARGLGWLERIAAVRFIQALKRCDFKLVADITVNSLLDAHTQPLRLRDYLWEPLCVAALNTPAREASAQVFMNVLRDSLAAERAASDLLLPRVDLSALFPDIAAAYIETHGGEVLRNTPIRQLSLENAAYLLQGAGNEYGPYSHVIIAVAPYHLATLIGNLPRLDALGKIVADFSYQPIVTCYLAYPTQVGLPHPMLGHAHGITQWLFDRGQLGGPAGLLAAVISAQGRHLALSHHELAARIHSEIADVIAGLPAPLWSQVIVEKRATFSCTPDLMRPATLTPLPGLLLAGDYVAGDYPATLEAAVRSGVAAAASIIHQTSAG